jgi:exodeoxyribonuclease VII small subunit
VAQSESPPTPPAFEVLIDELQKLVGQLEAGNLPLDESLRLYERGVALTRQANGLLEGAEKRIEVLQKSLAEETP